MQSLDSGISTLCDAYHASPSSPAISVSTKPGQSSPWSQLQIIILESPLSVSLRHVRHEGRLTHTFELRQQLPLLTTVAVCILCHFNFKIIIRRPFLLSDNLSQHPTGQLQLGGQLAWNMRTQTKGFRPAQYLP